MTNDPPPEQAAGAKPSTNGTPHGPPRMVGDRKFQLMLEETLVPSPNSMELAPHPFAAYQQRLLGREPQIAELYHENSKLIRSSRLNAIPDPAQLADVRSWFFETAYRPDMQDLDMEAAARLCIRRPFEQLPEPLSALLPAIVTGPAARESLYALDLWVCTGGSLYRAPVDADVVWWERSLTAGERQSMSDSLAGLPTAGTGEGEALLFVVHAAWRYMLFAGPRGYRHTLVDLGRFLTGMRYAAAAQDLQVAATLDFYDNEIDRLLGLDGVERSAVAAVVVRSMREQT